MMNRRVPQVACDRSAPMDDTRAEGLADDNISEPDNRTKPIGSAELSHISDQLNDLVAQGAEYHRRSVHREAVIDRLHEENQKLRDEVRASVFDPITADLMRLYDSFRRDADRLTESGADPGLVKLMESYADDVRAHPGPVRSRAVLRGSRRAFPARRSRSRRHGGSPGSGSARPDSRSNSGGLPRSCHRPDQAPVAGEILSPGCFG